MTGSAGTRIGLGLSLVIIGTALFVLYRMLRGLDLAQVIVALKATDADVTMARCSSRPVFHAHLYDLFALRTIRA